ncbi:MAG: hypothetical protein ACRDUV_23350 [Pseudonocardiaceae bacterium]
MGAFGRGKTHVQTAVHADNLGTVVEGHPPGDDPAVDPLAVLLDQREHLRRLVGDEFAHLLGELLLTAQRLEVHRCCIAVVVTCHARLPTSSDLARRSGADTTCRVW